MGEPQPQRQGGGCLGRGLIGCGVLLVVLVLSAVAGLVLNWSKVRSLAQSGATTLAELYRVQTAVQSKYGVPQVFVRKNYRAGGEPILSVQVVNLPAAQGVARDALRPRALEIAATARDALPPTTSFSTYQVIFTRSAGAGIVLSSSESFTFSAGELPARQASP